MTDSLAEQAIAQHVAYAQTALRDTGAISPAEADQEAAEFRGQITAVLGERPITDDILLGVAVGIWALQGALGSIYEETGDAEHTIALVPALVTMQITWTNIMRKGVIPAELALHPINLGNAA